MKALIFLIFTALLSSCIMANYEDVSEDPRFSDLIGKSYRTLENMIMHGVTLDANYKKRIDAYSLTFEPGFRGPELVRLDRFPKGNTITIKKVVSCTNCLETVIALVIDVNKKEYAGTETRLRNFATRKVFQYGKDGKAIINPEYFSQVNN